MTTLANRLLENSLEGLAVKIEELSIDHAVELQPICEALTIIHGRGMESTEFRVDLKELAEAVIKVLTRPGTPARLRELPIPPYDLWLPFKAEDLTPSDPEDLVEAMRIFNHKVSDLAFKHGCSNERRDEDRGADRDLTQGSTGSVAPVTRDSHGNDR